MNRYQLAVHLLHEAGVFRPTPPARPTLEGYPARLRCALVLEEAGELCQALRVPLLEGPPGEMPRAGDPPNCAEPDWPAAVDAIVDLLVVTYGAACAMGLDLDPFWDEVYRANCDKAAGPLRADGKRLKPEGWRPPDVAGVLRRALEGVEGRGPPPASVCMCLPATEFEPVDPRLCPIHRRAEP